MIDGKVREMDAVTDGDMIKTGLPVKVVDILEDNILKVELAPDELEQSAK